MKKPHYAWAVCCGAALLLFCSSGLGVNTFSVYQPYILALDGFTNTRSSLILTFRSLFSLASALLARPYYRRFSLRAGMAIAGALPVLAYVLFGLAGNRFPLYCVASSLLGIGYGLGGMIPVAILLNRWFCEKRNTALGICTAATGFSLFGFPTLITKAIAAFGLSGAFLLEAGFVALLALVSALLIRSAPADKGLLPYGKKAEAEQTAKKERLLTLKDWLLLVPALLLTGGAMTAAYTHQTVLITAEGYSPETAAAAMIVSGVTLMLGKTVYGRLGDKIGNYKNNFIFGTLMAGGLLLFSQSGAGLWLVMAAVILYSFGVSGLSVGLSAWPGDLAPGAGYEKAVQLFQVFYAMGALLFSSLPGILADHSGGSYLPAFMLFALFTAVIYTLVQLEYRRANAGFKKSLR